MRGVVRTKGFAFGGGTLEWGKVERGHLLVDA